MAIDNAKEKWGNGEFYMEEEPDLEDEALSLSDLPINLIKDHNSHKSIPAAGDFDFDFGSVVGFGTCQPPEMCSADDIFYRGQLLPVRLSVSSDNSSAGFYRRHGGTVKFNSSGSSSSKSQCSSSILTNNSVTSTSTARNSRPRVQNLFHSHPSPKPQIKFSPETLRQRSTGLRSKKFSPTWDFFRVGVVKAPGVLELQDLKHRSSIRRNSSVSDGDFIPVPTGGGCGSMRRPREREFIERKSGGILSGVGCKCSVESTVVPTAKAVVVRKKNIPAEAVAIRELRMKKVEKEKEQQEKLALSRQRTFEWLKELSHATFPCEAYILAIDHQLSNTT